MSDIGEVQARIRRLATSERARREATRALMPESAAIVDALRAAGISPAWLRLKENGKTVEWGRRTEDREVPPIPGVRR